MFLNLIFGYFDHKIFRSILSHVKFYNPPVNKEKLHFSAWALGNYEVPNVRIRTRIRPKRSGSATLLTIINIGEKKFKILTLVQIMNKIPRQILTMMFPAYLFPLFSFIILNSLHLFL
jgi:hypothetical protein